MDYRRIYKEYYGIEFDNALEIHHIDLDRTNNALDNLLLLTRELHREYHELLKACAGGGSTCIDVTALCLYRIQALEKLLPVLEEMHKWRRLKNHNYDSSLVPFIFGGTYER